ncbi:MAG: glycosyltransferase [Cyclobacteriaceae bacterium]
MKIRVLHCVETIASGGVEQTLLTLIKGLDKDRFEHKIICTWHGGPISEAMSNEGVELISVGSFKSPFEFRKLWKVVTIAKKYNPHVIHGAVFEGMTMATIGGFLGCVPIIILEETSDPQNRSKKADWLLKQFSRIADKVQAISYEVGEYLKNITKIDYKKIKVISNGIPIPISIEEGIIKETKSLLKISEKDIVIGFVGRLYDDHKRVSDLIEAISLLKVPNVKLLIIGEGKDRKALEERVKNLNLEKIVIFLGYQSKPDLYYQLMDVFCIPSSREGFGLVAAEAMINRVPVIATSVGGLPEIVSDEVTGFLVPPYSPSSLAKKLEILFENRKLRIKMGEAGFQKVMENYTAKRYCHEVENLYLKLLKSKGIIQSSY